MSTVQIDPQEKYIWVATDKGWRKQVGFTADVNGIAVTLFARPRQLFSADLVVSLRESGIKLVEILISINEVMKSDTKEATLSLFIRNLQILSDELNPKMVQKIINKEQSEYDNYKARYGKRPLITIVDDEWTRGGGDGL